METLTELGGALLPNQVNLPALMVKNAKMGIDAPKVRIVVGKNYGKNSDGSSKPLRAMVEERVLFPIFENFENF